jgi:hypothetical protein
MSETEAETRMVLWECDCGTVTVQRERGKLGVPEHVGCGELTYQRDL